MTVVVVVDKVSVSLYRHLLSKRHEDIGYKTILWTFLGGFKKYRH